MTTLLLSLLAFVGWTLLLVVCLLSWRGLMMLQGERSINAFPSGERHGSDAYWRLNRAHQNCLENLPIFAALVAVAAGIGADRLAAVPMVFGAAKAVPVARVVQSLAHMTSGSALAVTVRFSAFFFQLGCFAAIAVSLASVLQ